MHLFSERFFTILEGVVVDSAYIMKRMLCEFAGALAVFAKVIHDSERGEMGMDVDSDDDDEEEENKGNLISHPSLQLHLDDIILESYPELMAYYRQCLATGHEHFVWTGPSVTILPRSEALSSVLPLLVSEGELIELPSCPIFNLDSPTPAPATPSSTPPITTQPKRRQSRHGDGWPAKKHRS